MSNFTTSSFFVFRNSTILTGMPVLMERGIEGAAADLRKDERMLAAHLG
jgi:hypothetical protein